MASYDSARIVVPAQPGVADNLNTRGIAVEYFPSYAQPERRYHTHDFVEILYVADGAIEQLIADHPQSCGRGHLTILNYDQYHSVETRGAVARLINVYWKPSLYRLVGVPLELSSTLRELVPQHPMLRHRLNRTRSLQVPNPDALERRLLELYAEQESRPAGSEAAIDALFRLFMIDLCRMAAHEEPQRHLVVDARVARVLDYLNRHYTESVPLDRLVSLSGLRKSNLCSVFKRHVGVTIGRYLAQRRLSAAMQMLRAGHDKILTISEACGFSDVSRFNHVFRESIGMTPSEYRHAVRVSPPESAFSEPTDSAPGGTDAATRPGRRAKATGESE